MTDARAGFAEAVAAWAAGGERVVAPPAVRSAILVEGESDRAAVEALAEKLARDLASAPVIPMGGVTNARTFVHVLGPEGLGLHLTGLCDAREERFFRRAFPPGDRYFVCDADLEDELIRAHGIDGTERVIESLGDLPAFRTFQNQPAQRIRAVEAQLHRFMGTLGGRKIRYGRALVEQLCIERMPSPLIALLDRAQSR